jgi:hypothetical protein
MKQEIKITILSLFGFFCQYSFCQDTAIDTFKIRKPIYATAAGKTSGTIDREALIDSGGIVIHGCDSCKVSGFQMSGRINQTNLAETNNRVSSGGDSLQQDTSIVSNPQTPEIIRDDNGIIQSKTQFFTLKMRQFMGIKNNAYRTYYIEIADIKVITPDGEEQTLKKICLFLK